MIKAVQVVDSSGNTWRGDVALSHALAWKFSRE